MTTTVGAIMDKIDKINYILRSLENEVKPDIDDLTVLLEEYSDILLNAKVDV